MNQDMKYGYLDETYETICPLGGQDIFLAKNRDNGRIFVKKYVAASVIPVYEKLIAIRNEHLENIYDFAAGEERGIPSVAVKCVDIGRNTSGEGAFLDCV